MRQIMKHQDINKDAMLAYAVFDPGRQGHFNIRELRDALLASSQSLSPLEMAEIFRKADPNLDEHVTEKGDLNWSLMCMCIRIAVSVSDGVGDGVCGDGVWVTVYGWCCVRDCVWVTVADCVGVTVCGWWCVSDGVCV